PAPGGPEGEVPTDDVAPTQATAATPVQAAVPEGLHSIPFTMTVDADEAGFIGFVHALQSSPRLVLAVSTSWSLEGGSGGGPGGTVSGYLYVVPDSPAVSPAG